MLTIIKSLFNKYIPSTELAKKEVHQLDASRSKDKSRLSAKLQRQYVFKASVEMDTWKIARELAKNPILPNREILYSLYDEIMLDRHLGGQINTRNLQALGEEAVIIDRKTKKVDVALTELFMRPWFEQYSRLQLITKFYGHSLIEFQRMVPSQSDLLELEMSNVKLIPREHVKPESGIVVIHPSNTSGIPFREAPANQWLVEIGEDDNLGLLENLAPEVIWKLYSRSDWARRSEKFGMPVIVVRTEETDQRELDKKEEFLQNLGANGYAILDKVDEFELMESTQQDAYKIYLELVKVCNSEMSKLIVGQTMTADDGSSKSQADVHKEILDIYLKADMRIKQYEDNYILFPFLIRHGYPLEGKMLIYTKFLKQYQNPGVLPEETEAADQANKEGQPKAGEKAEADQEPNTEKKKATDSKKETKLNFF